jgi:hypothetical protein
LLQVTGRVPDANGTLSPFPIQSSELRLTAVESSFGSSDNGSISPKWLTSSINGLQIGKWEQSVRGGNFQTVSTTVNTPNYTKTSSDAYNQGTFDQFRAFFQDQWTFVFKSIADVGGGTSTLHTQTVWQNQSFTYNTPLTQTINGRLYNFVSYTDGVGQGRFVSPSYNLPTRYDALYKAPLMSNLSNATQGGNARSYVTSQSGSVRRELQVYESDGRVYLLYSSNGGSTWQVERYVGEGKKPSIAIKDNAVVVTYVAFENDSYKIKVKFYKLENNQLIGITNSSVNNHSLPNAKESTHPSVQIITTNALTDVIEFCVFYDGYLYDQHGVYVGVASRTVNSITFSWASQSVPLSTGSAFYRNPSTAILPNGNIAVVWQSGNFPYGDGIRYAEFNGSTFTTNFALPIVHPTVNYQFPTIAVSASGEKHIAWQALNHHVGLSVILYERLTASNGTTPLTQLQLGYSNHYKPSINWASSSTTILAESGTTSFAISKPDGQGFGSFTTFVGRVPNIVASGSKRYCYTTGAGVPYHIQFGEINTSGGGSAQERTLSGGNSGTISPVAMTLGGSPTPTAPSFQLAERVTARLSSEQASAFLELTLADVALNGRSRTGLTFHHLGASLLEDSATLTPQNIFKKLKSRAFVVADSITQISAVVKVRSDALYGLTSNANPQLAVELFNAETHQSLALSQTIFVSNADTAKDFHFTMNLPSSARGVTAELRVKVLGFAPHASHQPSVLNTITLLDSEGGTAMLNRIGGAWESVGSVPTKFALNQNYPNPFNPVTVIRYELPEASAVKLQVFDMLGRVVATVVNERREAGIYEAVFNASGLSSGTYFYRLQAGTFVETKKMMLVK